MDSNEKNNKNKLNKSNIIISIIIVLSIVIGCSIIIDTFRPKQVDYIEKSSPSPSPSATSDLPTTDEKKEEIEELKDEFQEYVDLIKPASSTPSPLLYDRSNVVSEKLTGREKIEYIGHYVFSKATSSNDYANSIITESDVKNAVEKVYGPNTYERTTFNLGCGDYTFRENENNYYSKTGCGGTVGIIDYNVIIDHEKTDNKIEITTAYVFENIEKRKLFKDFNNTISIEDYSYCSSSSTIDKCIQKNKDKLYHIIYTFESNDGINYYFKELKNIK